MLHPPGNPVTAEGLALGRRLFFDPILSADSTISCGTCHQPARAFTDGRPLSTGLNGRVGRRNTPGLANVGYLHQTLFWDGRADNLEAQALHPVADPNEMGGDWPTVLARLEGHPDYRRRFRAAFGLGPTGVVNREHVGRALAQFQRSLISSDSKYDRVQRGQDTFTAVEQLGFDLFFDVGDDPAVLLPTAECAHCHPPPHFTNQQFFNNGLDRAAAPGDFSDAGRGGVTGNPHDNGLFRTPSLRNVALTAPYMHDGRMATLAEVVAHYNRGGHYAANRSPNVAPLGLTADQQRALTAFLETLTDSLFVSSPAYQPPAR